MGNRDKHLAAQLIDGLKQLDMNIASLHKLHTAKGLDISHPYTKNTEDLLKIAYVNEALQGLHND